jgi:hypothetical protein
LCPVRIDLAAGPEAVARTVEKAVTARRPRTRYPVTPSAGLFLGQHAILTDRKWDAAAGTSFRVRGSAGMPAGERLAHAAPHAISSQRASASTG